MGGWLGGMVLGGERWTGGWGGSAFKWLLMIYYPLGINWLLDLRFFTMFRMTDDITFLPEASMSIEPSRRHEVLEW